MADASEFQGFTSLLGELEAAKKRYDETQREESIAHSNSTSALNYLNSLQKKFDAVIAAMRKEAARDTDWGRERDRPMRVT